MGNSVIYLPAYDAEIEYLESTGTQWIDTGVKPDNTYTFDCKVAVTQDNYNCVYWGTRNSGDFESENNQCYLNSNGAHFLDRYHEINLWSTTAGASSNWFSNVTPSVNTMYEFTGMTVVSTMNPMIYPIALFAFNKIGNINAEAGKCRIGYWKCYSNGHIVRDFIPVRIGSIGYMYDKVTKQLFANKGTGNFILGNDVVNATIPKVRNVIYSGGQRCIAYEKVYERKEWLCGDGSAYIDVPRSNEVTDVIHFKLDASNSGLEGIRGIFGNLNLGIGGKNTIHFVKYNSNLMSCRAFNSDNEVRPVRYNVMDVDILIDSVKVNSDTYELDRDLTALEGYSMPIFSRRRINADLTTNITNEIIKASLAYFKIDDVLNLIPCTLTMDLPASMDANNIARTKGTSGMWDLVSDRFYGNVASSGTFKAVNLAEGVDYEVHQWLMIPYTQYEANKLPINSNNINYKYLFYSFGNVGGLITQRYTYYFDGGKASIWNSDQSAVIYRGSQQQVDTPILIDCSSSGLIMGGDSMPNYGLSPYFDYLRISCYTSDGRYALSSIIVDGSVRYIPVKLLRSIPSKYDANGIARQAGECGMYDTVNDLFYGNVASSGTLSVSDD